MRLNVYSQEMTSEVEIIEKEAEGKKYTGVRFILLSPDELHHDTEDDDRSSVTLWFGEGFPEEQGVDLFEMIWNRLYDHLMSVKDQEQGE